jgi:dinuclear metal center YbgI/SA1388 family protein
MITLQELCLYLEGLYQASTFTDYCTNGMQVEGKGSVKKIATAVSASLSTIEAAVEAGVDALIVHHGLFWSRDSYVIKGVKRQKIQLLLDNNISLLAYHLPMDAHQQLGNNWMAARQLGWQDLQPFGLFEGKLIGVKGTFAEKTREEFLEGLEDYYCHPAHTALGGKDKVRSAALISGGAHKSIIEAASAGVDCFVTGSFDEPVWYQAYEESINFFALGHSNTEEVGPRALAQHLEEEFDLPTAFLQIENPF